ncbi:MAG: hypothetical protein ACI9VR_000246 [Cognaticolwellia sp.]
MPSSKLTRMSLIPRPLIPRPLIPRQLTPWLLFALGLLVHGLWALSIPVPVDWDPAYYREVAGNIVAGEGAVTHVSLLWGLSELGLPHVADLHWSPVPSRILVPGLWLWPAHGDQLITVLLAALWAPLAWVLSRNLNPESPKAALWAGLMASTGLGAARFLSTPDSIAIAGVLGGGLFLALLQERWSVAALLLAAFALCRGEGFLLSGLISLVLLFHRRLGPALLLGASGPLAWGLWQLRSWRAGGQAWLTLRQQVTVQLDYGAWVRGEPGVAWVGERVSFVLQALPGAAFAVLLASAIFLIPLALFRKRGQLPAAQALWLGLALLPPAVLVLAPAVAASGSVFRSVAVFLPMLAALAGGGLERAATLGTQLRGYPKAFVVGLALLGVGLISVGVGWGTLQAKPSRAVICPQGPGPYLASDPLSLSDRCAVEAHLLPRGVNEQEARRYLDQHPVNGAVLRAGDGLGLRPEEGERLLGWKADPQGILRPN